MKKITLLFAMLLFSIVGFSQFTEGFETEIPATFAVNNGGAAAGNTWMYSGAPDGGAHGGTGVASITYEGTAHSDDLITPQITVTAGLNDQLSFWIRSRSATFLEPYEVLLSTTDTAAGSFTTTLQVSGEAVSAWEEKVFDLTAYVGLPIYIAIRATGTNEWELFVDDVVSNAIPACPSVMNFAASYMVAPGSVDLTWDLAAGATMYNWEIQPQGITQGTPAPIGSGAVTGTSVTATGGLVEGTTYTAYVQSVCGGPTGVYQTIDFTFILPPANDECDNVISLTVNTDYACGTVTAGTTVGATASAQTDDVTGTPNTDVWFSFVASGSDHRVTLTNVVNQGGGTSTSTDMGMGVYNATGGCASLVFFDDSDPNTLDLTGLTPATTYYVRVFGWYSDIQYNNFDICIGTAPAAPVNDTCSGALEISALPYNNSQDGSGATNNGAFVACDGNTASTNDGVWYTFTTVNAGTIDIAITGATGWDSEIALYSGSCSTFMCVANADGGGNGADETISGQAVAAGTQYWINIGYYSGSTDSSEGPLTIDVTTTDTTTLGVEDLKLSEGFTAYPNPVIDELTISAKNEIKSLSIINMLGQTIRTVTPNSRNYQLDLSDLTAGIYFVKALVNNTEGTFRIVKK